MQTPRLATLLAGAIACAPLTLAHADPRAAEAKQIAKTFAQRLQGELQAAMQAGGPVQAVEVCHSRAPAIAAELTAQTGWEVGRTSLKRRNADNAPDAWEREVMAAFEARKARGEDPATLVHTATVDGADGKRFRFMTAIPTQPVCLTCHGGDSVADDVESLLRTYYPDDQARGYAVGDLRGAFTLSRPGG
ncbi:MAG: DUF3365 domain-containing protein [Gammaproteobacteria bacterium]|nr:DUF3365 domain-containing protein [Gammaproteobacteria bacterium]